MELKQNLIHRKYKKCEAKNQITLGDDYSVPDGKPDIDSVLQKKAELRVDEVRTEKGKIKLRGNLKVHVLYIKRPPDFKVCQISRSMPRCRSTHIITLAILHSATACSSLRNMPSPEQGTSVTIRSKQSEKAPKSAG